MDRYDVDQDDATYFGHSFGGLFGTYVLLTAPAEFRRYIIGSPSLWWDHGVMLRSETLSAGGASPSRQVGPAWMDNDAPVTVYLGVGSNETHEGRQRELVNMPAVERAVSASRYIDMVADTLRLAEHLRRLDGLTTRVEHDILPGEFHITVPLLTLSRGLRSVFDAPRLAVCAAA